MGVGYPSFQAGQIYLTDKGYCLYRIMRWVKFYKSLFKTCRNLCSHTKFRDLTNPKNIICSFPKESHQIIDTLERVLTENILPFWYPGMIDRKDGGYALNHDFRGKWKGRANKQLVAQARTLWFFSRLAKTKYGKPDYLKAARHGYEFLVDRMWDEESGGFYWEVDSAGRVVTKPHKHLYGQAFGIYALSEYASAAKDFQAKELASKLFAVLDSQAHDNVYGGYREFFARDWKTIPKGIKSYISSAPTLKTMNTHIHLLEAINNYYTVTKEPHARERLIELIFILSNAVVRKTIGACTDRYHPDWTPSDGPEVNRVSYGHDLENVWLLIETCNTSGIPNYPLIDLYKTLFSHTLKYGFDEKQGGFYFSGPLNKPADRREKIWWVQAEALLSAIQMYCLTKETVYFNCFTKTLDWIVKYQADWDYGDWHARLPEDGIHTGDKANSWKSPYHNGRAVLRCLELLQYLTKS